MDTLIKPGSKCLLMADICLWSTAVWVDCCLSSRLSINTMGYCKD